MKNLASLAFEMWYNDDDSGFFFFLGGEGTLYI